MLRSSSSSPSPGKGQHRHHHQHQQQRPSPLSTPSLRRGGSIKRLVSRKSGKKEKSGSFLQFTPSQLSLSSISSLSTTPSIKEKTESNNKPPVTAVAAAAAAAAANDADPSTGSPGIDIDSSSESTLATSKTYRRSFPKAFLRKWWNHQHTGIGSNAAYEIHNHSKNYETWEETETEETAATTTAGGGSNTITSSLASDSSEGKVDDDDEDVFEGNECEPPQLATVSGVEFSVGGNPRKQTKYQAHQPDSLSLLSPRTPTRPRRGRRTSSPRRHSRLQPGTTWKVCNASTGVSPSSQPLQRSPAIKSSKMEMAPLPSSKSPRSKSTTSSGGRNRSTHRRSLMSTKKEFKEMPSFNRISHLRDKAVSAAEAAAEAASTVGSSRQLKKTTTERPWDSSRDIVACSWEQQGNPPRWKSSRDITVQWDQQSPCTPTSQRLHQLHQQEIHFSGMCCSPCPVLNDLVNDCSSLTPSISEDERWGGTGRDLNSHARLDVPPSPATRSPKSEDEIPANEDGKNSSLSGVLDKSQNHRWLNKSCSSLSNAAQTHLVSNTPPNDAMQYSSRSFRFRGPPLTGDDPHAEEDCGRKGRSPQQPKQDEDQQLAGKSVQKNKQYQRTPINRTVSSRYREVGITKEQLQCLQALGLDITEK